MPVEFDEGDHQGGAAEEVAVQEGGEAADIALFTEFGQAFTNGGFAFMNGQPDKLQTHRSELPEDQL